MKQAKDSFVGQRSLRLVYATWLPHGSPKAVVVLVHGYGEHMGRYKHVVEALVKRDYAVYTIDHRGHGESQGARAHVERFDYFVDDLQVLVQRAKTDYPDPPLAMLGHSMGGLIATRYALRDQQELVALVLSGVALQIGENVSPLLRKVSKVVATLVPKLGVTATTTSLESILSRDPTVQELFDKDPLCYSGKVRARLGYEFMQAGVDARARLKELTLPLLIMHGAEDTLINPQCSKLLYEQASSTDKTLKLWPECRHEIFNELEKDEIIAFAADWLDVHVARLAPAADPKAA